MRSRTRTAKAVYWLSGKLSRIETRQRSYDLDGRPTGERRAPCRLSLDLLALSQRLDRDHWDHWTCKHDDGRRCPACGGIDIPEIENKEHLP